jgi:flagellar hook-length control protein FliK
VRAAGKGRNPLHHRAFATGIRLALPSSDYCVREPFLSNLTVSYVTQTPAASPAGGTAAAPAADNPLGFLAALIDQLLTGGTEAAKSSTGSDAGATTNLAGLLDAALGGQPAGGAPADPLAALSASLEKLEAATSGGAPAAPDALPALARTIDTLLAKLDTAPASTAAAPADISTLRDRLTALQQSLAATAPDLAQKLQTLVDKLPPLSVDPALTTTADTAPTAADPDAVAIAHVLRTLLGHATATDDTDTKPAAAATAPPASQPQDDLLRILATLGLDMAPTTLPAATPVTDATTETAATVPAPLLRLSNQLTQVATEIAVTRPELASKLEAVATRLVSADAGPDLLAKLTGAAAEPDGTTLDKLVQSLIEPKPATTPPTAPAAPQIAAPKELAIPAPIAPKQSKSAVAETRAAPPDPVPVTADSAPAPTPRTAAAAPAREPAADRTPEPKVAAKVEAKVAAVVADAAKSDPADTQPTPPQAQQPVPVAAQQARALPAAYQAVANPINMGQVAFEMVRQVHQGSSRFTIRLDPPELGRIDVKMHVDPAGTLNARLTVDRAETLDLFQRDQRSLERALAQAGLDSGKTNLEFSLRQQSHNPFAGMMGGDQRQQHPGYGGAPRFSLAGNDDTASMPAVTLYRGTASAGGVNIFA